MSTRIRPPWPLWHPSSIPLEEFKRMLADAAKHPITSTHDIDYLMDSVSASRGKTLRTVPVSMILDVSSILFEYASHKTWCMKAFRALDAFPHPINCLWSIRHICDDIVETLQKRLTIDHASVDKKEYLDNFLDCIPDQLGGYEGIWRIIFSYHYSSDEENYNVIKKGFKVMTVFAFYYPIDLAIVGAAEILVKTAVIYLERPDYIELMAEIMSRLVYVDWQRHVSTDRSRLMNAGICELCMILLTKYITNSKITCHCFMVIHNLGQCSTSAIKIKLRDAGACEIIVDSLRENCIKSSQSENNIGVAYSGLMAVDALTDYFQNDALVIQEIINKFVTAGLCEIVMIILEKYAKDSVIEYDWSPQDDSIDSVLDCAQSVIRNLAFNNKTIRCKLNQLGAGNWLPELF